MVLGVKGVRGVKGVKDKCFSIGHLQEFYLQCFVA